MVIINTTFHVHTSVADDVLKWIKNTYQPSGLKHGALPNPVLVRVLGHDQPDAASYATHLTFPDMETAQAWDKKEGELLRSQVLQRWGEKALPFHTFLDVID
ncbi:MAG: DUF4286 family protein [Bacteroidales bacterium]|nr:DUF4286 family protein [Bacteroidales bacterium]